MVEFLIHYRSTIGTLCLTVLLYFAHPTPLSVTLGFFMMMGGATFRAWASGYIDKNNELATDGPYSLTRNPLYFGNFIIGIGIAISGHTWLSVSIALGYCLFFFPFLMVVEHRHLKRTFGTAYVEWARQVGPFFPRIGKIRKPGFNISLYMKNREYRVLYLTLFVTAILILKVLNIIRTG